MDTIYSIFYEELTDTAPMKSAAPRSGVSDQPNNDALPPKLPKRTKFLKLIEPRARRASPQGHGKSLPDAVKTIDFASLLEGFWPNPSNRLRPSVRSCRSQKLKFAILSFDLSSEASKVRYCRSLFFRIFKNAIL